jgi:class 3 adenylate cyclase
LAANNNYWNLKDSIYSEKNKEKIIKMGLKNEYERKNLADSLKAAEKQKVTRLQLQRQRSITYLAIGGILLLVGFSFFIARERSKSETERKKSDQLLLNILPGKVAEELKATGGAKAQYYDNTTVLFADFVNFTKTSERMSPQALIDELHSCFKAFDEIMMKYGIEKIKTIGDAYLAVAGLPNADGQHGEHAVQAALDINAFMEDRHAKLGNRTFQVRIGINSGGVVAGIVGVNKFAYDIWGDTVNTASRMESNSEAGKINISQTTYELVKDKYNCVYRGEIEAKNKGMLKMYYVSLFA